MCLQDLESRNSSIYGEQCKHDQDFDLADTAASACVGCAVSRILTDSNIYERLHVVVAHSMRYLVKMAAQPVLLPAPPRALLDGTIPCFPLQIN